MSGANEPWSVTVDENHWYGGALRYALEALKKPDGACLVIGSPLAEANALADLGWVVTYLDVREPPAGKYQYVHGDAMHMPFDDDSFGAISSTCVLCHVGMGRYGDLIEEDGDVKMLREMYRVLKKKAIAALMWGPLGLESATVDITHRIYSEDDAIELATQAGFHICDMHTWQIAPDYSPYLCMVLEK